MAIHKLTARQVETARPGKYEDGAGLRLVVSKTGAKKWVLRYTLNGRHEMGLGSFTDVSLAEARDKAATYRKQVSKGIDPQWTRRVEPEQVPSFTTCAARYIRAHRKGWKNFKHRMQWVSTLKTYARPIIGSKSVDAITTDDILKILTPIWGSKTETAKRIQGRLENILDYAAAHKFRDQHNPARWRGHLDKLLAKPSRVKTSRHHPAMPYDETPDFMAELSGSDNRSALALRFLILTATRTSEVLEALWSEIDLEAAVWTIPAERMKAGKEHRVPLSDAAMSIMKTRPQVDGNPYAFPGYRHGHPLSGMTMLQQMRRMGFGVNGARGKYVPHGFRSSFSDWASEETGYSRHVVEMALAHTIENKVEAAYRRGDLFAKRQALMQEWADHLNKLKAN